MKKEDCKTRPWTAALIVGAILIAGMGFAIGWAWDKRPGSLHDVSILNVLTAVGTVGATMTALFLAGVEARRRASKNQRDALILAEGVLPTVRALTDQIIWASNSMNSCLKNRKTCGEMFDVAGPRLASACFLADRIGFESLQLLPLSVARNLQKGLSEACGAYESLKLMEAHRTIDLVEQSKAGSRLRDITEEILGTCKTARSLLESSIDELHEMAREG